MREETRQRLRAQDEAFARDPQVQALRRVFAALERAQGEYLARAGVDPLEPALRRWRARTRALFTRLWGQALARGLAQEPEEAAELYLACLARVLEREGVEAPEVELPAELARLMREVLP
jgi:hypothetical protein